MSDHLQPLISNLLQSAGLISNILPSERSEKSTTQIFLLSSLLRRRSKPNKDWFWKNIYIVDIRFVLFLFVPGSFSCFHDLFIHTQNTKLLWLVIRWMSSPFIHLTHIGWHLPCWWERRQSARQEDSRALVELNILWANRKIRANRGDNYRGWWLNERNRWLKGLPWQSSG